MVAMATAHPILGVAANYAPNPVVYCLIRVALSTCAFGAFLVAFVLGKYVRQIWLLDKTKATRNDVIVAIKTSTCCVIFFYDQPWIKPKSNELDVTSTCACITITQPHDALRNLIVTSPKEHKQSDNDVDILWHAIISTFISISVSTFITIYLDFGARSRYLERRSVNASHYYMDCNYLCMFKIPLLTSNSAYKLFWVSFWKGLSFPVRNMILNVLSRRFVLAFLRVLYQGPLSLTGFNFMPRMENNYIQYKVWDKITYPSPNFNGATVEVWDWISNFIPHFTGHVITYPCWD